MPNPAYANMIGKHILLITFLNESELIFFYTQLNDYKLFV